MKHRELFSLKDITDVMNSQLLESIYEIMTDIIEEFKIHYHLRELIVQMHRKHKCRLIEFLHIHDYYVNDYYDG